MLGSLQPHVLLLGEITPQAATLYAFITNVTWGSRLVGLEPQTESQYEARANFENGLPLVWLTIPLVAG